MGNCIKKQPAIKSDGGDWKFTAASPETKFLSGSHRGDSQKGEIYSGGSFGEKTATTTEVKIKISKKQLEELLGRTDVQGLTVEQILGRLMNVSDRFETHQRPWRPNLHSIPE